MTLVRQSVYCYVQGESFAVFGADAFAAVAGIVHAKGTAKAVLTEYGYKISLVKKTFELDVPVFVETADSLNCVEGTVDEMVIGNHPHLFFRENPPELAPPGFGKFT